MTAGIRRRDTARHLGLLGLILAGHVAWGAEPPALGDRWAVSMPTAVPSRDELPAASGHERWSLAQLTDYALRHNPQTRQAWEAALVDGDGVDVARASLWPTLSADVPLSISRTSGGAAPAAQVAVAAAPPVGWTRSAAANLSLSWVVFDFGARQDGVRAARWQAAATALAYDRELQTVVNSVEKAYFAELAALELVRAQEASLKAAAASVEATSALRGAGMATLGDDAQARSAMAAVRLQLVQARAAERSDAGALAVAAGLPVNIDLQLAASPEDGAGAVISSLPGVDELLAQVHLSRADLRALDAQVEQADAQRAAIQAQGLPSVSFTAGAGRDWTSASRPVTTQQAALAVSIPIFDGGLVRAQTAVAREKTRQIAAQRDAQAATVQLDVWQAYQIARTVGEEVDAAQQALASAVVGEESARERYRAGMGTFVELLVAQGTVAQARVAEIQARYDARIADANLGYAVGAERSANGRDGGRIR